MPAVADNAVSEVKQGAMGNQFLTFSLGEEAYGIDILKVQEIKGYTAITPIPNTPPHVRGVMNLRGTVIPVVDLRVKFRLPSQEYNRFTVIIVVHLEKRIVGLIVDAVSEVVDVAAGDVRPAPDLGSQVDTRFIEGMTNAGDKLVVLLDVEKLFQDAEFARVADKANTEV